MYTLGFAAEPLPLTTPESTSTPSTTTNTTTTTSTTTTTTTTITTLTTTSTLPPTILPASTSNWTDFSAEEASKMMKFAQGFKDTKADSNEIIVDSIKNDEKEFVKDGTGKQMIVDALLLNRSSKKSSNFNNEFNSVSFEMPPEDIPIPPLVDLGIFGSFWLQKPKAIKSRSTSTFENRPAPIFNPSDYLDKYPELRMRRSVPKFIQ